MRKVDLEDLTLKDIWKVGIDRRHQGTLTRLCEWFAERGLLLRSTTDRSLLRPLIANVLKDKADRSRIVYGELKNCSNK